MGTTKTIKNKHSSKHAANGSGVKGSLNAKYGDKGNGVIKAKKDHQKRAPIPGQGVKGRPKISDILKKRKQRVYSEKELGIPELNMITPVGVTKPKGKKKGKVFVDDRESMTTILALVQAEKEGQIESKMIKARQLEEIREARRAEAESKDEERKAQLEETKDSIRKKRKRPRGGKDSDANGFKAFMAEEQAKASRPDKTVKKKKVSFAPE